jgi:hypothetical protein
MAQARIGHAARSARIIAITTGGEALRQAFRLPQTAKSAGKRDERVAK